MITAPTGVLIPTVEPGSAEWLTRMSASKIAAVVGLSPWDSRFSLWHRMAGLVPPEPDDDTKRRGHYLEPAVATWFADQHPDWQVSPAGTFVHPDDDRLAATPDRLVTCDTGEFRLLECKTASDDEEWGIPLTDEIPVYYRAQVVWQMYVTGARTCHVAVLTKFLEFREYVVAYDESDARALIKAADEFLRSLPDGASPQRPNIDGHSATYQVVRELNPDIVGDDFPVPHELAERFCAAQAALKAAKAAETAVRAELADEMGACKRARFDGKTIADRRSKAGGIPYLQVASRLPEFTTTPKAA
jgi:putative phage-type endonuclease